MARPLIVETAEGYWLLLKGASALPTRDPLELAARIEAITEDEEQYIFMGPDTTDERYDFWLTLKEERQRLREHWNALVTEAESEIMEWWQ